MTMAPEHIQTIELPLPKPLPHTRKVLESPARFKVMCNGRRWGKTATSMQMILRGHGTTRNPHRGAIHGGHRKYLWMALTYKQIQHSIWKDLVRATKPICLRRNEQDKSIELITGATVYVASAENPDAVLGSGYNGVILDEASRMDKDVWQRAIRPAIEDVGGWAAFISTPNGKNWFHDLFQFAGRDENTNWQSWQLPSRENPLMTEVALREQMELIGPRTFAQEYEAQFVEVEGAEWPSEYFPESMWVDQWPAKPYMTVLALDPSLGKTDKSDFSSITVAKLDIDTGILYIANDTERRDITRQCQAVVDIARVHKPDAVVIETNNFQSVMVNEVSRVSRENGIILPIHTCNNWIDKNARIRATLTPYLARKEVKLVGRTRGNREWMNEAVSFPLGDHDDGLDSSEMAIRKMYELVCGKPSEDYEVHA